MRCAQWFLFVVVWAIAPIGCGEPMLWIGELTTDAGSIPPPEEGPRGMIEAGTDPKLRDPASRLDAASPTDLVGTIVDRDAGAMTPRMAEPPRAGEPAGPPDAAAPTIPEVDEEDEDAGIAPPAPEVPTELPVATSPCPVLSGPGTYTFGTSRRSLSARVFIAPDARTKPAPGGPLIMYWHALASSANQVLDGMGQETIDEVTAKGGVVASFTSKYCADCGLLADDVVWYVEDDIASDHLVACALEQARIDPRHIHAIGHSAGAMRTLHLALARSNFIASVVSYSGGDREMGRGAMQDPSNKIASIVLWGGARDNLGLDYRALALQWYDSRKSLGWYTMLCDHGGGHAIPSGFGRHALRFFLDHPYKVSSEPYATTIPSDFPDYCTNERPIR